ncbi:hypothetical protein [Streptomyces sp. NPDC003522]
MLAVFGTLVGCSGSGGQKEYGAPSALCGIPIDSKLILEFLPAGKEINVQEKQPVPSTKRCQVNIDNKWELVASQEWWEETASITEVADAHPQLDSAEPTEDKSVLFTGTGAVARVKNCATVKIPGYALYTALQLRTSDLENGSAMKKLITAYTKEVERSSECRKDAD